MSRNAIPLAILKAQIASKKPQPYAALVTDVRNFGFFVDVPDLGLSGVVPLSAIPDDFFIFDPATRERAIRELGAGTLPRPARGGWPCAVEDCLGLAVPSSAPH